MSEQMTMIENTVTPLSRDDKLWFRAAYKECNQFGNHMQLVLNDKCFDCQQ